MTALETEIETETMELSATEVARRVAVLKRFRELLSQQRDRFHQYLEVLDKQKDVIEGGSADDLIAHVELEEKIVADIFAIQKVIDPLEDMYQAVFPMGQNSRGVSSDLGPNAGEVPGLKAALEELKAEAVVRSARNKELLSKRMDELRLEMKTIRGNPYGIRTSVFSSGGTASLVDIKG